MSAAHSLPFCGVRLCSAGVDSERSARRTPRICSRTESPTISRHKIADWNCTDSDGLHWHIFRWKMSHYDVNQAAFHALTTTHDEVRRHLCRIKNPNSCRKTKPTGAKMKTCSKESTCRSFDSWCMVYIHSSDEGEQKTNDEASNESGVSKFCTLHLKFRPPSRFF
jgi:hypothetical protein